MNATFAPAFYYLPAQLPFLPSPFAAPLPFGFVFIKTQCGPSIESVQAVRQPAAFQLELINVDTGARTKGPTGEGAERGGAVGRRGKRIVYNWHVREADVQSCALVIEIAF